MPSSLIIYFQAPEYCSDYLIFAKPLVPLCLKIFILRISKLPAKAGIIKLINQMLTDVNIIPRLLAAKIPINCRLTSPLMPSSTKVIEGITASAKKTKLIPQIRL